MIAFYGLDAFALRHLKHTSRRQKAGIRKRMHRSQNRFRDSRTGVLRESVSTINHGHSLTSKGR